jgi:hypothetical protein
MGKMKGRRCEKWRKEEKRTEDMKQRRRGGGRG